MSEDVQPPTHAIPTELRDGLAPREAERRLKAALALGDVGARVAGFYLASIADTRGYSELGCSSFKEFVVTKLRRNESTARNLASVARGLRALPVTDELFAAQRLTYSQVRLIVAIATPQTDRTWAEWALERSLDQLAADVAGREKGDLPTTTARRPSLHHPKIGVGARLTRTQFQIWQRARAKLQAECGFAISDGDMMLEVAQTILRSRPDGTVIGRTPVNDTHYLVHAYPRRAGSAELVVAGSAGEDVPVDPTQLTARLQRSPATVPEAPPGPAEESTADVPLDDPDPRVAALDPENSGPLVPLDQRAPATSQALREEVLVRDAFQCRACHSRQNVTVHHRRWRRYGGTTDRANLLALCAGCHSLVHVRLLLVLGDPEGSLRFLDCEGNPVQDASAPSGQAPRWAVVPTETATTPDEPVMCLERLPQEVDAAWWARHGHLFSWNERRGELMLTPGHARAVPSVSEGPPATGRALDGLVGQSAIRERLAIAVAAAKKRGEPLGHQLFAGLPGLGKTALSRAVAVELGASLIQLAAPLVRTPDALVRTLASLPAGGVLFLDEVHALPARAAEVLYEALDHGTLSLSVREKSNVRGVRLRLAPFTLIGATTDPDQLTGPLLSRLRVHHLEPYRQEELTKLLDGGARARGLELTSEAAARIAAASRDTPRRALALLDLVRDEAVVAGVSAVELTLVERVLAREGVDAAGLDPTDRGYLAALEQAGGPVALGTLAAKLATSEEALRTIHEPLLIRRGLVRITPSGRTLAAEGRPAGPVEAVSPAEEVPSAA